MALAPEERYECVQDLQAEIQAYRDGFATSAEDASLGKLLMLFIKRHKGVAVAALLMLALIIAALLKVKASEGQALAARDEAEQTLKQLEQSNLAQQCISQKATPEFVAKAAAHMVNGEVDLASDAANTAVGLAPELSGAWHEQGRVHMANHQYEKAAESFRKARLLDTENQIHRELYRIAANHHHLGTHNARDPQNLLKLSELLEAAGDTALAGQMYVHMGNASEAMKRRILHALKELEKLNPGLEFAQDDKFATGYSHYHWHYIIRDDSLNFLLPRMLNPKKLANISPLKGFPMDAFVSLPGSNVSDLSPLTGMPLKHLLLDDMPLVGLSALLEHLRVSRTKVSDLSPLRGMKLRTFHMDKGKISDLSPLAGMPLEDVSLGSLPQLVDLEPLRGMPLKKVQLGSMPVNTLDPLLESPIEELVIKGPAFNDINKIGSLPLKSLTIYAEVKVDLDILAGKAFDRLALLQGTVSNPADFANLTAARFVGANYGLTTLNVFKDYPLAYFQITDKAISDISALAGKQLESFYIQTERLTDISVLKDMPLINLGLTDCPITSIEVLKGKKLQDLRLQGSTVSDINVLRGMPINYAHFDDSVELTDLSPLKECPRLRQIALPPNYGDISFVKDLPGKPLLRVGRDTSFLSQEAFFAKHPVNSQAP